MRTAEISASASSSRGIASIAMRRERSAGKMTRVTLCRPTARTRVDPAASPPPPRPSSTSRHATAATLIAHTAASIAGAAPRGSREREPSAIGDVRLECEAALIETPFLALKRRGRTRSSNGRSWVAAMLPSIESPATRKREAMQSTADKDRNTVARPRVPIAVVPVSLLSRNYAVDRRRAPSGDRRRRAVAPPWTGAEPRSSVDRPLPVGGAVRGNPGGHGPSAVSRRAGRRRSPAARRSCHGAHHPHAYRSDGRPPTPRSARGSPSES